MFAAIPIDLLTDEDLVRFGVGPRTQSLRLAEDQAHAAEYARRVVVQATDGATTAQVRRGRHVTSPRRNAACEAAAEILRCAKATLDLSAADIAAALDLSKPQAQGVLHDERPFEVGHLLMYLMSRTPDVALPVEVIARVAERLGDGGLVSLIEKLLPQLSAAARQRLLTQMAARCATCAVGETERRST